MLNNNNKRFCSVEVLVCLSLLIFAILLVPIVFSQQVSYAVKLPKGDWIIFLSKYPHLTYRQGLTISSVAQSATNIYKVTGSLLAKSLSGTYDEGSGKITFQTSSSLPGGDTPSATTIYTGYLITHLLDPWWIPFEETECLPNICKYTLVGTFSPSPGSILPGQSFTRGWYAQLSTTR